MTLAVRELPSVFVLGDLLGESPAARAWRQLLPALAGRGIAIEARRFWPTEAATDETDHASGKGRVLPLVAGKRTFDVVTRASESFLRFVEDAAKHRVPRTSPVLTMDTMLAQSAKLVVPEGGALVLLRASDVLDDADAFAERLTHRLREMAEDPPEPGATGREHQVVLTAPVLGPSGYAAEGRMLFDSFECDPNTRVVLRPLRFGRLECGEDEPFLERVREASIRQPICGYDAIHLVFPPQFQPDPKARKNILRTMYETDSIPESWIDPILTADELWVPSAFHVRSFGRYFPRERIRIVPELVDPALFENEPRAASRPTRFLSMFDWSVRKAPELLLETFGSTFCRGEAELRLKLTSSQGLSHERLREMATALVAAGAARRGHEPPTLSFVEGHLAPSEMPAVYRDVDAFVLASRGEGWGRPIHEAMASGLPVVATAFGGSQDLLGAPDCAFVVGGRVVPVGDDATTENPAMAPTRGSPQRWLEPSREDLAYKLRMLHDNPERARAVGERGRQHVAREFRRLPSTLLTSPILDTTTACTSARPSVLLEGPLLGNSSYARITRALAGALISSRRLEVGLRETTASPLPQSRPCDLRLAPELETRVVSSTNARSDICVRSGWPISCRPPDANRWVQRFDWEYGALPVDAATTLAHGPDEIWVHSTAVLRAVTAAGIARDKVQVIPHGIDPAREHPELAPLDDLHERVAGRFAFLFVGATIPRKGFDVLLTTWLRKFRRSDPVCLIVKSADAAAAYAGQGFGELLSRARQMPDAAEIIVVDRELSDEEMPSLYATADCLVHPFRGEGFGMPLLEARACGLPVVLTAGGAPDDFLGDAGCLRIASERVPARLQEPCIGRPWLLEPDADALAEAMTRAVTEREQLRAEAESDSSRIRAEWSWARTAERVLTRIDVLR